MFKAQITFHKRRPIQMTLSRSSKFVSFSFYVPRWNWMSFWVSCARINVTPLPQKWAPREKCPNTGFFSPYLARARENTDQKKFRICTLFTQWTGQDIFRKHFHFHFFKSMFYILLHLRNSSRALLQGFQKFNIIKISLQSKLFSIL